LGDASGERRRSGASYAQQIVKRSASVLFLIAVVAVLYRKATRLWWTYDDAWNVHVAAVRPWLDGFTAGDIFPQQVFTPLRVATYELLLLFAGMDPDHWYRVQLGLLALTAIAVFFALRMYTDDVTAFGGAVVFAAGPPLCAFATQLMVIHSIEAILLGTLATMTFIGAFRRKSNGLILLSSLLYFGAMLANGVALLLPIFLAALPEGTLRVRLRHLVFHGGAFVAYLVWRYLVLDGLAGGGAWAITARDVPMLLALLPWRVILAWTGAGLGVGLVALAILTSGSAAALRDRRAAWVAGAGLFVALAPIVALSKDLDSGHVVIPWLWVAAVFAIGTGTLGPIARGALVVFAATAVIVANRQEWTAQYARSQRMSSEARAFMNLDSGALLRRPAIPPATMPELKWLKEEHYQRARGTGWFYDDSFLCSSSLDGKRIFEWTPARRDVVEVTARIPDFARAWCGSLRANAPLRTEFRHRGETLYWRFGPYEEGRWTVVLGGGLQAFEVPREEGFRLVGVPGLSLRVRYDSPDGWVTYSPELMLNFKRQPDFLWQR
jgi:hypothetical protein